jgi:hypothetical protein
LNNGKNRPTGASARPQRHRRDSQLTMPFTYVVNELKRVNFEVTVFRPIPIPVSFFEVEVSGFLIGQNAIKEFVHLIMGRQRQSGVEPKAAPTKIKAS